MSIRTALCTSTLALSLLRCSSALSADPTTATYTWMLPRTVLDVSVVYSYAKCTLQNGHRDVRFKITPTISAHGVPDRSQGLRSEKTSDLNAAWEDRNISLSTFANSHILSAVGASPVNQIATVIGNILGGVAKLVGIGLGVPATGVAANSPPPDCADDTLSQVAQLKGDISTLQKSLSAGPAESDQKKFSSQIAAKQALMADLQASTTLTIKTSIDPGYTDKIPDLDPDASIKPLPDSSKPVSKDGMIASLLPSVDKLVKLTGLNLKDLTAADQEQLSKSLTVNVYLDFAEALPNGIKATADGFDQKNVEGHDGAVTYREPALIPVSVWQGNKYADQKKEFSKLLAQPVSFPFAQFGSEQVLPLKAQAFQNLSWSVTFTELGESTNATYTSKSWMAGATQLFSSAASASNGIASEQRSAALLTSPSADAAAIQAQSDLIYQTQRLALCEANNSSCPAK